MNTLASIVQPRFEFYVPFLELPKKTDQFQFNEVTKRYDRIAPAPELPTQTEWTECKKYVDNLTKDYKSVITQKASDGLVNKIRRGKGFELVYEKMIGKFNVELNILESFIGEVKIARYYAYFNNLIYIRDLIGNDPLNQF